MPKKISLPVKSNISIFASGSLACCWSCTDAVWVLSPWVPISEIIHMSQSENQSSLLTPPCTYPFQSITKVLHLLNFSQILFSPSSQLFLAVSLEKLLLMKTSAISFLLFPCIHSCLLPSFLYKVASISFTKLKSNHPYTFQLLYHLALENDNHSALEPFGLTPFLHTPSSACSLHSSHNGFLSDPRICDATRLFQAVLYLDVSSVSAAPCMPLMPAHLPHLKLFLLLWEVFLNALRTAMYFPQAVTILIILGFFGDYFINIWLLECKKDLIRIGIVFILLT